MHFEAVAEEGYDSALRPNGDEIAVLRILRYGLRSCHWSSSLLWWLGLAVCDNSRQARFQINFISFYEILPGNYVLSDMRSRWEEGATEEMIRKGQPPA
jgi:hypothetical protein